MVDDQREREQNERAPPSSTSAVSTLEKKRKERPSEWTRAAEWAGKCRQLCPPPPLVICCHQFSCHRLLPLIFDQSTESKGKQGQLMINWPWWCSQAQSTVEHSRQFKDRGKVWALLDRSPQCIPPSQQQHSTKLLLWLISPLLLLGLLFITHSTSEVVEEDKVEAMKGTAASTANAVADDARWKLQSLL